jgi:hypothetical protein
MPFRFVGATTLAAFFGRPGPRLIEAIGKLFFINDLYVSTQDLLADRLKLLEKAAFSYRCGSLPLKRRRVRYLGVLVTNRYRPTQART